MKTHIPAQVHFECDRCAVGERKKCSLTGEELPLGWVAMVFPGQLGTRSELLLCAACSTGFDIWMRMLKPEAKA